jgi:hypothetical protein
MKSRRRILEVAHAGPPQLTPIPRRMETGSLKRQCPFELDI